MKERTPEMETAALLRRIKRLGVRQIDVVQTVAAGGCVLAAKVQNGRAHAVLETRPHRTQYDALEELADLAAGVGPAQRRRRGKPTAKRLQRPGAGEPTGEVDDVPMGEQPERMAELPHEQHRRRQAEALERAQARSKPSSSDRAEAARQRVAADKARRSQRGPSLPAQPPRPDRPGRGGGR